MHVKTLFNITVLLLTQSHAPNATISLSQHTVNPFEYKHITKGLYITSEQENEGFYQISSSYWERIRTPESE